MKIKKIEEVSKEKKDLYNDAIKFAAGFLKLSAAAIILLYDYLLISAYGLDQTLKFLVLGITTGILGQDIIKN